MFKLRTKRTMAPARGLCSSPTLLLLLAALLLGAPMPSGAEVVSAVSLCDDCDQADVVYEGTGAEQFGFSAAMGHLNGDLLADLVIGAPEVGRVYVFFGSIDHGQEAGNPSWPDISSGAADVILRTQSDATEFGFSVAVGPRIDGEAPGEEDLTNRLIVGAPGIDTAFVIDVSGGSGTVVVDEASPPIPVQQILGPAGSETGHSVAMGPAISPDEDDYVVGARVANDEAGTVWVIQNTAETTINVESPAAGLTIVEFVGAGFPECPIGSYPDDCATTPACPPGESPCGEGLGEYLLVDRFDGDGDGPRQVAIGAVGTAPDSVTSIPGRVYLVDPVAHAVAGSLVSVNVSAVGWLLEGESIDDFFGFSMASGDFDADSAPDLAVGAIYADRLEEDCGNAELNSGAVYFFDGQEIEDLVAGTVTSVTPVRVFWGDRRWDELGFSVAAGDVNGDALADLLASARRADRDQTDYNEVNEGAVYAFLGGLPWFSGTNGTLHACLDVDCTAPADCTDRLPDAGIFGGDWEGSASDEAGFFVAAGDVNQASLYDDVLVTSLAHERAYLVSLNNGNLTETEAGQDTDGIRDIADDDDDGDGYLDVEEDFNANGLFDDDGIESDPLVPNRDVSVEVVAGDMACDGSLDVTVTVTNRSRRLTVVDPQLQVDLPGDPFVHPGDAGSPTRISYGGQTWNIVDGTNPFAGSLHSIHSVVLTVDGAAPSPSLLPDDEIQVVFTLLPVTPLLFDGPNSGTVSAEVALDAGDNELPTRADWESSDMGYPNDDDGVVELARPDLDVTKTSLDVDGEDLDPEDILEYTIEVANTGPLANDGPVASGAARDVFLTDAVPTGTSFVRFVTISQGTITSTDPPTVDIGSIDVGQTATVVLEVQVSELADDGDHVENQADVTELCLGARVSDSNLPADDDATEGGNDPSDAADDDTTKDTVTVNLNLVLTKIADSSVARPGDSIDYTYTVFNGGNSRLKAVNVVDPAGCAPIVADPGNDTPHLDPGETWTYTCSYVVQPGDLPGPIDTVATANALTLSENASVSDTDSFLVDLGAIALTKTGSPNPVADGATLTYTFEAARAGSIDLENVLLSDPACAPSGPAGDDGDGILEAGEIWTWTCDVTAVAPGPMLNTATVAADVISSGPPVGDTADESVDVGAITLVKTADVATATVGDTINYTYVVGNAGSAAVTGLAVTDDVCAPVTLDSGDANSDGILDVGETWSHSCAYVVQATDLPGPLVNNASADGTAGASPVSATDSASVELGGISLTKTADVATATVGDTVTYTYLVGNTGNAAVTGLAVTDDLCAPVTLDSGDANSDGILDVGETWSHSCPYLVLLTDLPGPLVNNASADGTADGNPVSAADSASVDLAGITLAKTADVTAAGITDPVTYTYVVDNGGSAAVNGLTVTDDVCAPVVLDGGDANSDGILDVAETWTHSCTYFVQLGDFPGPLVNNASADGTADGNPVSAADSASVDLAGITLTKTADVATAAVGETVTYTYVVDNVGAFAVTGLAVTDDLCAPVALDSGDANSDGILDVTETWNYSCAYVVQVTDLPGPLVNEGTAAGLAGAIPVAWIDWASVELTSPLPSGEPSVRLSDGGALEWTDVPGAVSYHLYRGDLQTLRESRVYTQDDITLEAESSCWLTETFHDDGYMPEPGRPVFYLVTSDEGSVEGSLGPDSSGVTRPNDNPCR